ncbi:hypothetical protein CKO13_00830 [Halorhodospira neutriphila]|uniref:Uncharacterized protein n=1 Tax=Halorhodospira neutriphila TaxID=168379 RepID=A0ABS1E3P3_9GAMM|nr:hypothetical protein [Halorhodospira neutriphila]
MYAAIGTVFLGGVIALLAGGVAVAPRVYRQRPYREPAAHAPRFVWFPKYRLPLAEVPSWPEVEARLAKHGLTRSDAGEGRDTLRFTRGSPWQDFSIRRMKVDVTVQGQPAGPGEVFVEAGGFALFDTGDTWQLTREIAESLQAA